MKELSLNILDITMNSVKAEASLISISMVEDEQGWMTLEIADNGCGMSEDMAASVADPFCTTRTTRKVGLGVPLLKMAAEQTGGDVKIVSSTAEEDHGTTVTARFDTRHIDFTPIGDIVATICTLIQGSPDIDFVYSHKTPTLEVSLDTRELRAVLGDVSLAEWEIISWIEENLREQYQNN